MANICRLPYAMHEKDNHSFFDDFYWFITAHMWTTVASDTGTLAHADAAGGIVTLTPSDGTVTNNDETYIKQSTEGFKFAAGKPMWAEARLQFTEGATDDVNVFFGFKDAIAANTLVDDGAGLATSFSGACIYKVDGGTVWKCVSSNGATQTISTSAVTAGGTAYQTLRIEVHENTTLGCKIIFMVNDSPLRDSSTNLPITHYVLYASATEMQVGAGIKNGADTTAEALLIDYIAAGQVR